MEEWRRFAVEKRCVINRAIWLNFQMTMNVILAITNVMTMPTVPIHQAPTNVPAMRDISEMDSPVQVSYQR